MKDTRFFITACLSIGLLLGCTQEHDISNKIREAPPFLPSNSLLTLHGQTGHVVARSIDKAIKIKVDQKISYKLITHPEHQLLSVLLPDEDSFIITRDNNHLIQYKEENKLLEIKLKENQDWLLIK